MDKKVNKLSKANPETMEREVKQPEGFQTSKWTLLWNIYNKKLLKHLKFISRLQIQACKKVN